MANVAIERMGGVPAIDEIGEVKGAEPIKKIAPCGGILGSLALYELFKEKLVEACDVFGVFGVFG